MQTISCRNDAQGESWFSHCNVPEETKVEGHVTIKTYRKYVTSMGKVYVLLVLVLSAIAQTFFNVVDIFIGFW